MDEGIYSSVLATCVRGDNVTLAEIMPLLELMEAGGALPSTSSFNSVLNLVAKPGTGKCA